MSRALLLAVAAIACAGGPQPAQPQPAQPQPTQPQPHAAAEPPRADVKAPGNLPVLPRSEADAEVQAHHSCIDGCLADRQTDPRPIAALQDECRALCDDRAPVRQVEIVPDDLPMPPDPP